jgi:hypothetical protein
MAVDSSSPPIGALRYNPKQLPRMRTPVPISGGLFAAIIVAAAAGNALLASGAVKKQVDPADGAGGVDPRAQSNCPSTTRPSTASLKGLRSG